MIEEVLTGIRDLQRRSSYFESQVPISTSHPDDWPPWLSEFPAARAYSRLSMLRDLLNYSLEGGGAGKSAKQTQAPSIESFKSAKNTEDT
jgi:hypothetical protein